MASISFPTDPVNGQEYTFNNIKYVYIAGKNYWRAAKTDIDQEYKDALISFNLNKLILMGS
jgi:hypothetical protein